MCQSVLHNHLLQSLQRAHLVHPTVSGQAHRHWDHHHGRAPIRGLERTLQDVFEKQGRTTGVFAVIREKIERMLPPDMPMVVALDDTLRQKSGTGIPRSGLAQRSPRSQIPG